MKSIIRTALLAALMLLMLLPLSAQAVEEMQSRFSFYVTPGETLRPDYPPLAHLIDSRLTENDFNITYSSAHSQFLVAEDGTVTVKDSVETGRTCSAVWLTYTPKLSGRGRTVRFTVHADVKRVITEIQTDFDSCVIALDQQVTCNVEIGHNTVPRMKAEGYDESILELTINSNTSAYNPHWNVALHPKKTGKTSIDFVFYGGIKKTVEVEIVNPPTGITMSSDEFTCYVNEPLDVGTQLIGGSGYNTPTIKVSHGYTQYGGKTFFPDDIRTFISNRTGAHYITMTTHNGHEAKAVVNVRDRVNCVRLEANAVINEGVDSSAICAYDADGNLIEVELEVIEGKEIASFVNGVLKSTGSGTIVVTAHNPDGTAVSGTFEIFPNPNEIILNETHVTLNVGDTFDLEVGFDQGKADYTISVSSSNQSPPFGLYPIRREGLHIIATAPGISYVTVQSGLRYATCTVEVLDGDKAVSINVPESFGVGHTHQLQVTDKTGKVYPATFTAENLSSNPALTITPDGMMTGLYPSSSRIYAKLEDGRVLQYIQKVLAIPTWLEHADMEVPENYTNIYIDSANSDVGIIRDLIVEIEDESIVSGGTGELKFHKTGTTKVTLTAVNGGAQTTFNITVLPADDRLYVLMDGKYDEGGSTMDVAMYYSKKLPVVTDYYGNVVPVTWKITHEALGLGNPNSYAFRLNGSEIYCAWPSGVAQVTGTAANGETVRMQVHGYRLADQIVFRQPEGYTLEVGETVQVEVSPHPDQDPDRRSGEITWSIEGEEIIRIDMHSPGVSQIKVTGLEPGTITLRAKQISGRSITCTVKVIERLPGDFNHDGVVDLQDALAILQRDAGWRSDGYVSLADVNNDGQTDKEDAVLILRYCAGENVTLE